MSWVRNLLPSRFRFRVIFVLAFLLISLSYLFLSTSWPSDVQRRIQDGAAHFKSIVSTNTTTFADTTSQPALPLPTAYDLSLTEPEPAGVCADRYGSNYLRGYSKTATNYCDTESTAKLTCFSNKASDSRTDSFCVGWPASIAPARRTVTMDCNLRDWGGAATKGIPQLSEFPAYWYNTGPSAVFNFIQLKRAAEPVRVTAAAAQGFTFLVKREGDRNLWHTMMEIMALTFSLDVLRTTVDPSTGNPFFSAQDAENSQIVFLDTLEEGPFYALWSLDARKPPLKIGDATLQNLSTKIVVPLPGGSNPFWEGDWVDLPCAKSELLRTFSRRVLAYYSLLDLPPKPLSPLTMTLVDRKEHRRLINQASYFAALQAKYPTVNMQIIDFAAYNFSEQLQIVQRTDILVGVHGAGLTHGMFLPPESTIVEILPLDVKHKGFKNMAKFLGHRHFSRYGVKHGDGDWHDEDVFIEEERFAEVLDEAIRSATGALG